MMLHDETYGADGSAYCAVLCYAILHLPGHAIKHRSDKPTTHNLYVVFHLDVLIGMEIIADRLQCPFQTLNGFFVQLVDGAVELLGDLEGCHMLHGLAALSAQPEGFGVLPIVLGTSAQCTMCPLNY